MVLISAGILLLSNYGIWLPLTLPIILLFSGIAFIAFRNYLATKPDSVNTETPSADKNHIIGQTFQQQGHLDWAFEKFKTCPLNASLMTTLYKLGQEYEDKQQFKKAVSVTSI